MPSEELVTIGKLGKPFGLTGELYITPATDYPERFLNMKEVYVRNQANWQLHKVRSTKFVGRRPVMLLQGINNPEEAALFTNRELGVPRSEMVELPADTWFVHDLIGCDVYSCSSGRLIGKVKNVQTFPANDVYFIWTIAEREVMLPAVTEFVKEIDTERNRIVVETSGFLDEEESLATSQMPPDPGSESSRDEI